jgi:glutathione S-transferase
MVLYTCGAKKSGHPLHPCGRAAKALDEAGHSYEVEVVAGFKLLPWTRRGDARAEVERLTGQSDVPVLLLDDGQAMAGTSTIVEWAGSHPA